MPVRIDVIKQLRDRTQASFADCREVLEETGGDIDEAAKRLRMRGAAIAEKRGGRETNAGIVEAYVHSNGKIGVLVDLRSETDFVSRSEEFKKLAHDIALHIAAASPRYLSSQDIPPQVLAEEKRLVEMQFSGSGKPPQVVEKIVSGKLASLAKEVSLLEQPFVKDPDKTMRTLLDEAVVKFGENIKIEAFSRLEI